MVDRLVDDCTVVTYDRRGLSRSVVSDPAAPVTIGDHADDVARLLTALADGPALMLGLSMGALIGLHVAATRPELLDTLIAHEPVAPWLLSPAEQAAHRAQLTDVQEAHARAGLAAALPGMVAGLGIDPATEEREPDLTPQPMNAQRVRNFDWFIGREFTSVVTDDLDLDALCASKTRIVPGQGRATASRVFTHRCAGALATLLGAGAAFFPGGHNGNLTHPRAFAVRVHEVLGVAG